MADVYNPSFNFRDRHSSSTLNLSSSDLMLLMVAVSCARRLSMKIPGLAVGLESFL